MGGETSKNGMINDGEEAHGGERGEHIESGRDGKRSGTGNGSYKVGVLCKWGTTALFDKIIFNLKAGSYLQMTPEKALAKVEKEKKYKYLYTYL